MKCKEVLKIHMLIWSPSVWREWIEIIVCPLISFVRCVSLRVEGVD